MSEPACLQNPPSDHLSDLCLGYLTTLGFDACLAPSRMLVLQTLLHPVFSWLCAPRAILSQLEGCCGQLQQVTTAAVRDGRALAATASPIVVWHWDRQHYICKPSDAHNDDHSRNITTAAERGTSKGPRRFASLQHVTFVWDVHMREVFWARPRQCRQLYSLQNLMPSSRLPSALAIFSCTCLASFGAKPTPSQAPGPEAPGKPSQAGATEAAKAAAPPALPIGPLLVTSPCTVRAVTTQGGQALMGADCKDRISGLTARHGAHG